MYSGLIRAGVPPVMGGVKLFSTGLSPFDLVLDAGWERAGGRAFVFDAADSVVATPTLALSPVEAGGVYSIAINVTGITGSAPQLIVRLGYNGATDDEVITATGSYLYEKKIAGAENAELRLIANTNTTTDTITIKSLFVNRVN